MRYLLLIYQNEAEHAKLSQEELNTEFGAYMAFGEEVQKKGVFLLVTNRSALWSLDVHNPLASDRTEPHRSNSHGRWSLAWPGLAGST